MRASSPTSTMGRSIIFGCAVIRFTSSFSLAFSRLIFAALNSGSLVRTRCLALNPSFLISDFSFFFEGGVLRYSIISKSVPVFSNNFSVALDLEQCGL